MATMDVNSPSAALDAIGFGRFQWLLLCYTGLGWFADACEVMLLSFLGPSIRCQWAISASSESTLTSVVFAGMLGGVYVLGALADAAGRRRGFFMSAILLGAAGLASALAPSFMWLLLFRAIVGVALGGTPIIVTLFAEFVPSAQRGRWLLLMQSFWTIGTMFEACLAWAVLPSLGWRWLLALSATPLLLLLVLYPWLPESPHWLVVQGRYAEAEATVLRVAVANRYNRPLRLNFGMQPEAFDASGKYPLGKAAQSGQCQALLSGGEEDGGSNGELHARGSRHSGNSGRSRESGSRSPIRSTNPSEVVHEYPLEDENVGEHEGTAWMLQGQQAAMLGRQSTRRSRRRLAESSSGSEKAGPPGDEEPVWELGGAAVVVEEVESDRGSDSGEGMAGVWRATGKSCQHLLRGMRVAFKQLYGPRLLRTTLLLYVIWFVNAMTYYGLVLLTTALQTASKEHECTEEGKPNLSTSDFTAILVTSMAEAPGLLAAAVLVDWCGRKWTLRSLLLCCACCVLLLALSPGAASWQLLMLFMARAAIEGSFCALYVYTPELYPTPVRAFGLALCNAFSRIGGFLAPYATVYLVDQQDSQASELLLGTLCLGAMLAAFFLPYETKGTDLHDQDEPVLLEDCGKGIRHQIPGERQASLEVEILAESHPDSASRGELGHAAGGREVEGRGERDMLLPLHQ